MSDIDTTLESHALQTGTSFRLCYLNGGVGLRLVTELVGAFGRQNYHVEVGEVTALMIQMGGEV